MKRAISALDVAAAAFTIAAVALTAPSNDDGLLATTTVGAVEELLSLGQALA